jgi:hypothetical protein
MPLRRRVAEAIVEVVDAQSGRPAGRTLEALSPGSTKQRGERRIVDPFAGL